MAPRWNKMLAEVCRKVWNPAHGTPTSWATGFKVRFRRLSAFRHLPRVERLIADAIALDTRLRGDWAEVLSCDWQIERPRSRRGQRARVDADVVARLRTDEGLSLPEIAERLGVHKKTPGNVLHRFRQRQIPALPDDG